MKPSTYIMPPKIISVAYSINFPVINTNTEAREIFETKILSESLNR
jgi:hypothetical protein